MPAYKPCSFFAASYWHFQSSRLTAQKHTLKCCTWEHAQMLTIRNITKFQAGSSYSKHTRALCVIDKAIWKGGWGGGLFLFGERKKKRESLICVLWLSLCLVKLKFQLWGRTNKICNTDLMEREGEVRLGREIKDITRISSVTGSRFRVFFESNSDAQLLNADPILNAF